MEVGLIEIGKAFDDRGELIYVDLEEHIPFKIKNVFFIRNVPSGSTRGNHANTKSHEVLICVAGNFTVTIGHQKVYKLQDSTKALIVPNGNWIELSQFSSDAVCLVLSSDSYDPEEKITND